MFNSNLSVYIRRLTVEDVTEHYVNSMQDPTLLRLTEARHRAWNEQSIRQYIRDHRHSNHQALFGIFLESDRSHIGNVRIFSRNEIHKRCELSILLFGANARGRGFGTAAIKKATEFAFSEWRMHRVMADYYEINKASARAFEKAGFEHEGTFRDHFRLPNGDYVASIRVAKLHD